MNKELILSNFRQRDYWRRIFFEKDTRFGGFGWVHEDDPNYDNHIGGYTWEREESNANIDNSGFSFFLACFAFKGYTFTFPDRRGKRYNFSKNPKYKVTGFLNEKPELGLVEVSLVGENKKDFDQGLIISSAREVVDEKIALYIKEQYALNGPKHRGIRRDLLRDD